MNVYINYVEQGWYGDTNIPESEYSVVLDWNLQMNEVVLSVTFCFKTLYSIELGNLILETNRNIYTYEGGSSEACSSSHTVSGYQLVGIMGQGLWCISLMGAHFDKCLAGECSPNFYNSALADQRNACLCLCVRDNQIFQLLFLGLLYLSITSGKFSLS